MSIAAISQSLFELPIHERVALADQLYASIPADWQRETDQAWLREAERRSAEMDESPESEQSHEQFLAGILTMDRVGNSSGRLIPSLVRSEQVCEDFVSDKLAVGRVMLREPGDLEP